MDTCTDNHGITAVLVIAIAWLVVFVLLHVWRAAIDSAQHPPPADHDPHDRPSHHP